MNSWSIGIFNLGTWLDEAISEILKPGSVYSWIIYNWVVTILKCWVVKCVQDVGMCSECWDLQFVWVLQYVQVLQLLSLKICARSWHIELWHANSMMHVWVFEINNIWMRELFEMLKFWNLGILESLSLTRVTMHLSERLKSVTFEYWRIYIWVVVILKRSILKCVQDLEMCPRSWALEFVNLAVGPRVAVLICWTMCRCVSF